MPNRYTPKMYDTLYRFVAARDGERCLECRKGPPGVKLQIDHADNNPQNWQPDNLHLFCQRHNLSMKRMTVREKIKYIRHLSALCVCEKKNEVGEGDGRELREMIDYWSGGTVMQASCIYWPRFCDFSITAVRNQGQVDREDLIYSGAMTIGCSAATTHRYLNTLKSSAGPFREIKDPVTGIPMITFRHPQPAVKGTSQADSPSHRQTASADRPGDTVPISREKERGSTRRRKREK